MSGVLGRGAADRVVPKVNVDWRRPGQRGRYLLMNQFAPGPQPMKFWEVCSAFRGFEHVLADIFALPEWRVPYLDWLLNRDNIIQSQDRKILDALVPVELSAAIAMKIPLQFEFDGKTLRRNRRSAGSDRSTMKMSAIEVHDRFGGAYIEDVLEHGSATIRDGK